MEEKYRLIREKNARELERRFERVRENHPKVGALLEQKEQYIAQHKYAFASEAQFTAYQAALKELNERIQQALLKAGLPGDYLQPIFTCPICQDTGYVDKQGQRQKCSCNQKPISPEVTFADVQLDIYDGQPKGSFAKSPRENMEGILAACEAYCAAFPAPPKPNLLFFGNAGLGKTYLAKAIGAEVEAKGFHVVRMNSYTLFQQFKEQLISGIPLKEDVFGADLLIVDDFGTEPMYKNITVESFFALFNERLENKRPTVVVTNLSFEELKDRYGERLVSRLYDKHCTQRFCFYGKDLRL